MSREVVLTEEEIEAKVEEFALWIKEQPNMPQDLGKPLLARYLKIYSFRLERAQKLLQQGLEFRKKYSTFFTSRDPESEEIKTVVSLIDMIPLSNRTKENYKVCIYQILSDDATNLVFNDCVKTFFMACDFRFHLPQKSLNDIESGEVIIFDMKNLTFKHLTSVVISTLRMFFKYLQEAHPVRIIQLHVINCTPFIETAMRFVKPFMYDRLYNALKFHNAGNIEDLYEYVPREILPVDYGGDEKPMAELKEFWVSMFEENREFLMDDCYYGLKHEPTQDAQSYRRLFSFFSS